MATTESDQPTPAQDPPPLSPPVAKAGKNLSDKILSESVGLLHDQILGSLLGAFLSAGILAVVESTVVEHSVVTGWLGAMAAVSIVRYLLSLAYRNSRTRETNPRYWRNLFMAGAITSSLVWGSAGVLLFTPTSIAHQSFLGFILAGICAGTVPVLAPSLPAVSLFLSFALLPLALQFLLQDSDIQIAMGGMLIVFYLFLLSVARSTHGTLLASLALRHANLHLIEYLTGAKDRAESAIQRLQTEIRQRGGMEQQLKKARDEAERASRSKGDFLATISHEIRTPMNGVLGALELVQGMPLGSEQRELVATAHSSAESLISIINDVLDFSKIEVGRLELEGIEFDLRTLVAEVTGLLGNRARDKGLKMSYQISPTTPDIVRGDPTRLRQILNNLVGNAVKFTDQGKIDVRVDVARSTPSNMLLRFEVEDTGIGISPAAQASLFQPFTQAESSMARKFGGTGLGLSITRQLVELMGGRIGLRSKQGKGSTFWFTLFLAKPALTARPRRTNLRGTRLLALTVNQELSTDLGAEFRQWGTTVEFTASAEEMMGKLKSSAQIGRSWSYDAVIMDAAYGAERLSTLTSDIRSNRYLTGTALILIGMTPGEQQDLEEGVDACVPRPLQPQALFEALAGLIDEPASSDILSVATKPDPSQTEPIMLAPPGRQTDAGTLTAATEDPAKKALQGRLLLVEDNPVNQRIAKNAVERLGLSVTLASDGFQAIEAVMDDTYDLVLMDCQMPGMDGLQATKAIRRIEINHDRKRVPIVAVTANAMEGDRERCISSGMDDYLAKPFKQRTLRDVLAKWLPEAAASNRADPKQSTPTPSEPSIDTLDLLDSTPASGRILVADDDLVNRRLARATLERLGYSVDLAANGGEAILAVEERGYDAILMDCEMPEVDGIEATLAIRRMEQQCSAPRTPILALTGYTEESDRERCRQAGMDDILTKPIKRKILAECLRQHVSRTRANMEAEAMSDTNANAAKEPALDEAILADLKEIMGEEFGDLIQAFLKDTPARMNEILEGIRTRDTQAVRILAHTLKSSAANLGALSLSEQARKLEMLAREGSLAGSKELLKQMAEEYKRARRELKAL